MVIQNQAGNLTAELETLYKSLRITDFPIDAVAWNSIGVQSGLVTTLAANGAVFSLRNISANLLAIKKVGIGFVLSTAFTTAQKVDFGLIVARNFTASDSGGTAISLVGNNAKKRTSLSSPTSIDARVSQTVALTAGTKTLDTNLQRVIGAWAPGVGTIIGTEIDNLFSCKAGDMPLILQLNEGINIQNLTLMGAGGVGTLYINVEFAEILDY